MVKKYAGREGEPDKIIFPYSQSKEEYEENKQNAYSQWLLRRLHGGDYGYYKTCWAYHDFLSVEQSVLLSALGNIAGMEGQAGRLRISDDGRLWFRCASKRIMKALNVSRGWEERMMASLDKGTKSKPGKDLIRRIITGMPSKRYICINYVKIEGLMKESWLKRHNIADDDEVFGFSEDPNPPWNWSWE